MSSAKLGTSEQGQAAPLYRQLRPRPHGPGREEVEHHQRTRMYGAMIEAVAAHGYAATSVAEVSRLAGVSKRTFYEQFANREACFLATHDRVVECALERIAVAQARHERDWEGALRGAFEAFVLVAAEQPKAARLVLLEASAAGPVAWARLEGARRRFVQVLTTGAERGPGGAPLPPAIVRGIVSGVEHVVRRSLLAGAVDELMGSAGELAAWALAQASPVAAELSSPAPRRGERPEQRPRLRARERERGERALILRAAVEIAVREGYARLTPMQIVARAGVSERVFRANYDSVEECFVEAADLVGLEVMVAAATVARAAGDGPSGAYRGIAALMGYVVEDAILRGLIQMDALAEDVASVVRRERMLERFVDLLASRLPQAQRPPSVVAQATVGGVWGIIRHYVAGDAAHLLPGLTGQAAYVALAPVVGPEQAVRTILAEQAAGPRAQPGPGS